MDKETQHIVTSIAEIQVEALKNLQKEEIKPNAGLASQMISDLLEIPLQQAAESEVKGTFSKLVSREINQRIDLYTQMQEMPNLIKTLDEYQLMVCAHILWRMEEHWMLDNSQGVEGAWALINALQHKFHPELILLKW